MAPSTRGKDTLAKKIATLQLRLAPLVPLPSGPPHPDFPKTLMAFHLLTEDQLDSIAHYYHQSTPGPWTNHYPANMNWDKDFLAKKKEAEAEAQASSATHTSPPCTPADGIVKRRRSRQISISHEGQNIWLEDLMKTVEDISSSSTSAPILKSQREDVIDGAQGSSSSNPYAGLTEKERIRIKRRKVGKFIGLVGMETPVEEIAGRVQACLDRAVEQSREELRRNEEVMLRRRKMA